MTAVAFRADIKGNLTEEKFRNFLQENQEYITKSFFVIETGERTGKPHIQGIGYFTDLVGKQGKTWKRYRDAIKELIGECHKNDYSFTSLQKDEDSYISYLMKQQKSIASVNIICGYTEDFLCQSIGKHKSVVSVKDEPIAKKLLRYCISKKSYFLKGCILDERRLFIVITSFFGEETKKFRHFLLIEHFNMIKYHFAPKMLVYDMLQEAKCSGTRFRTRDIGTGYVCFDPDTEYLEDEEEIDNFFSNESIDGLSKEEAFGSCSTQETQQDDN